MLKKSITFKKFKKFKENLLDSSKFAHRVFVSSKHGKKRWAAFQKNLSPNTVRNSIKVSSFYSKDLDSKQKNKLINLSNSGKLCLLKSLVDVKFVRSPKEGYFVIRHGFILVNGAVVSNANFILKPGDLISFRRKAIQETWVTNFFFTKYKSTTINFQMKVRYEVSFSGSFFVVCFLITLIG